MATPASFSGVAGSLVLGGDSSGADKAIINKEKTTAVKINSTQSTPKYIGLMGFIHNWPDQVVKKMITKNKNKPPRGPRPLPLKKPEKINVNISAAISETGMR